MAVNQVYPLTDKNMVYNKSKRRYILTIDGVINGLGINLVGLNMTSKDAERLLDRQSLQVYNFVNQHTSNMNAQKWKRYAMAKDDELRDIILEALLGQIEYYIASAGSLTALQTGVSIEKLKVIELSELRGKRRIAEPTETILEISGLLYTGFYVPYNKGLEDGTF